MSTDTLEQPVAVETESDEDQLWRLKARIRAEHPHGFYYIQKDGTVTDELWVLLDITREDRGPLRDGARDVVHIAKIRPASGKGEPRTLPLGELMGKPLLDPPEHR